MALTVPENPGRQRQPLGMLSPQEVGGQGMGVQVLMKKGAVEEALTLPEKPALQVQPLTTSRPKLLGGQSTGVQ